MCWNMTPNLKSLKGEKTQSPSWTKDRTKNPGPLPSSLRKMTYPPRRLNLLLSWDSGQQDSQNQKDQTENEEHKYLQDDWSCKRMTTETMTWQGATAVMYRKAVNTRIRQSTTLTLYPTHIGVLKDREWGPWHKDQQITKRHIDLQNILFLPPLISKKDFIQGKS